MMTQNQKAVSRIVPLLFIAILSIGVGRFVSAQDPAPAASAPASGQDPAPVQTPAPADSQVPAQNPAATPAAAPAQGPVIKAESKLVIVDAVVTDKKGAYV